MLPQRASHLDELGMDIVSQQRRSELMARIRSSNTRPERVVRSLIHALGYRFRLHRRDLPGTPDLVFPGRMKVIFINGCYWHRHPGCSFAYMPKSNVEFWSQKFKANIDRDRRVAKELEALGWHVHTIWECETSQLETLTLNIRTFLDDY